MDLPGVAVVDRDEAAFAPHAPQQDERADAHRCDEHLHAPVGGIGIEEHEQPDADQRKIEIAGRLGGAEMARREKARDGRIPLQTLRANVDYGFTEARTTYGVIGVKVWIYKGEVFDLEHRRTAKSGA